MADWDKLGKLMRLTESEHDGEVLNALRMANRMLAADNLNWSDVFAMLRVGAKIARKVVESSPAHGAGRGTARYGTRADQRRPPDNRRCDGPDIDKMFQALSTTKHDVMTMVMLAGFKEHWDKNRYLTGAQYDTLKQMHEQSARGGRSTWRF